MNNSDLANTFDLIGDLLEIKGEVIYKTLAYRKAADSLRSLGRDVNEIWRAGELTEIPGVGKAIAEKIDELLSTGKLGFLEKLSAEVPPSLVALLQVPDVGPKKAALLWKQANITTLDELEAAAAAGKLRGLPGIGEKMEAKILAGIGALKRREHRVPLGRAYPVAQELIAFLRALPGVKDAEMGGSLRRMRATVGDLDLVAASPEPDKVMDAFIHHPMVAQVVGSGAAKSSVELHGGLRAQLWVQPPERYGTLLQFVTGSKDHSVRVRELAQQKGLSLSEQRILKADGSEILCATEEEVYAALGMRYIPPEMREDRGEVDAARKGKLPRLITGEDMRAELHSHTTWSDGRADIYTMAQAAKRLGLTTLGISDHSGSLGIVNGMHPADLPRQREELDEAQRRIGDSVRLLQGVELEIKADGSLDYPDEVLAGLDFVIASLHVSLRQPREQITQRLLNAIRNPHVDIIGHPTGGMLPDRDPADLDMDAVLAAAAESGVALEINADPARLDLNDIYARRAVEMGIPLTINRDAHAPDTVGDVFYGIATARRGWVEPDKVINTWEREKLLAWFTKRG